MTRINLATIAMSCCLLFSCSRVSTTETCDPQTVARAVQGYTCVAKTKRGSVAWRVEAVISTGSRTFRVVKDLKSGLYVSDDMGKHPHESAVNQNLCQSPDYSNQRGNLT